MRLISRLRPAIGFGKRFAIATSIGASAPCIRTLLGERRQRRPVLRERVSCVATRARVTGPSASRFRYGSSPRRCVSIGGLVASGSRHGPVRHFGRYGWTNGVARVIDFSPAGKARGARPAELAAAGRFARPAAVPPPCAGAAILPAIRLAALPGAP
ncbi:hypothetical protein EXE55_20425 [Burkholderia glumae]|uniref:hypothetical protein n=1 Tax=Burkholderia glumae TaxID=337 RepID=UPI001373B975|nr:hypothetical protein [Burkholderia glumae]MCR1770794.1 hypothetical protein [Burkholderia glumae]QHP93290.1 hypothetical protein EXE55_20425 [Burkholderia glumae]